jgi:hypothetical protein
MLFGPHRTVLTVVCALLLTQVPEVAGARTKPLHVNFDRDYASALATADRFLHAWQAQDAESGLLLLTDRVRQHTDEGRLHNFFSAERSSTASFEVGSGKKLSAGRYEFPVALFTGETTGSRRPIRPQSSALIVVRIGRGDWAIDKLP